MTDHILLFKLILTSLLQVFTPTELSQLQASIVNGNIQNVYIGSPVVITGSINIQKNIVCVGDSNTAGTTGFTASKRYCDLLGINHPELSVYNASYTTLTATDLITRNVTEVYPRYITGSTNIATLLIGTNDFYFNHTISQTWNDVKTVIAGLKNKGFQVYVLTYPPRVGDSARNTFLRSLNAYIMSNGISLGYTPIDTYSDIVDPLVQDQVKVGMLQPDFLHFTELAHQVVSNRIENALGYTSQTNTGTTSTGTTSTGVTNTGVTSTGAIVYATIGNKSTDLVFSNNILSNTVNGWRTALGNVGKSSGKWYWEMKEYTTNNNYYVRGIAKNTVNLNDRVGADINGWGWYNDGGSSIKGNGNSWINYSFLSGNNDVIGFALDMDNGTLTAYKNGVSQGIMYSNLSGTFYPSFSIYGAGPTMIINFGSSPFAYTPPAGFNPLTN